MSIFSEYFQDNFIISMLVKVYIVMVLYNHRNKEIDSKRKCTEDQKWQ